MLIHLSYCSGKINCIRCYNMFMYRNDGSYVHFFGENNAERLVKWVKEVLAAD